MANMYITDIQHAVLMRAEVTADNTSVRVLCKWSHQDLLMCFESVRVDYQPEGDSLMMHTVDSATANSATKYPSWKFLEISQAVEL